jgi:ribosome maturation factor RimP
MERNDLAAVWDAVEPYLAAERLELDDLELVGRGRARTLRVTIDSETEKVDLDRIAAVARGLSRLLDHLDQSPDGPYQLEVTSPGLERKLTRFRHFQKSIGREVIVKTASGTHRGVLAKAGPTKITLANEESSEVLALQDVISARTVFTWEKPAKPGQRSPRSSRDQGTS